MPYKSSRTKHRSKPKEPGKFEIGAFGLVIGFAVGLTCGILMGGFARPTSAKVVAEEMAQIKERTNADAMRKERLQASMNRLKSSGKDVEPLQQRYAPEQSGSVQRLNHLLSQDSGPISVDDL